LLPFAAVHGQLHGVAVAAMERLVFVQQRLHRVGARGQVAQRLQRIAGHAGLEGGGGAGRPAVHVDAEGLLALGAVLDLESRLLAVVLGDEEQQPSVEGPGGQARSHAHREARPGGCGRAHGERQGEQRESQERPGYRTDASQGHESSAEGDEVRGV
jgi:hypothetical protein